MSGADSGTRELIGFEGAVSCELQAHAQSLRLRGTARGGAGDVGGGDVYGARAAEIAFSGILFADGSSAQLPPVLQQVSVLELRDTAARAPAPAPAPVPRRSLRIESGAGGFALQSRSVQVHRDAARAFFGALPPVPVPRSTRAGWALLLTVLRVPGAARLLAKLRG